jgi:uncharacterized Zn finger protein (UPF0148 family)
MKKHLCYVLIGLFLFSCGQDKKEKNIPENDKIEKITVYQKSEIMNDTLKPYLFIPSKTIKDDTIRNKSYKIYIHPSHVQLEMYIRDTPPFINTFWGEITANNDGFSAEIPINSCILKSGKYQVIARIYPRYGQTSFEFHSYLEMEGYYKEANTLRPKFPMFTIKTPDRFHKDGKIYNPITGFPYFELRTEIEVEVPYEVEGWSHSVNLKKEEENRLKQDLQQRYDEIRQIITKKDSAAFRKLIQEREDLLAIVYYLSDKEKNKRINELIEEVMGDEYAIAPYPKEAQMLFFAEGKMVTLVDPINREGIIRLVNKKDPNDIISLDFRFHRKQKGGQLSVI